MSAHPQIAEDLVLYSLGSLPTEEQLAVERHLQDCAACRMELQNLRGDMALLALSAAGPAAPRRARTRLLAAVRREPRLTVIARRRSWWTPLAWAAAAAAVLMAGVLWRQNRELRQDIATVRSASAVQFAQLEQARAVVETLTATDAMRVTLVAAKTPPQPQGKAIYMRDRGNLIFMASNLPALPALKAYELWLIPMKGAPMPAGMFKPDAHGGAMVINPPLPVGTEAKAFAITIEPEGGSSAPTMPIMMAGTGE